MIQQIKKLLDASNSPAIVCDQSGKRFLCNEIAFDFFNDINIHNFDNIKDLDPDFDLSYVKKNRNFKKTLIINGIEINTEVSYATINMTSYIFYLFEPYYDFIDSTDLIIEHIDDVIVLFDEEGRLRKMNAICDEVLPFKRNEATGELIDDLISAGYVKNPIMKDMLLKKKKLHRNVSYPNGKVIAYTATPIFNKYCNLKGGILTGRDITRIFRLMTQFNLNCEGIDTNEYISKSIIMKKIKEMCIKAAGTDSSIFISGESGTGKEVLANMIHNYSNRRDKPFIAINCGAIPSELLESELFGYVEGAFTGSKKGGKKGVLEEADGGTIFFDEIGELPLGMQKKLLRVIQELKVTKIGSSESISLDLRFISATNVPIKDLKSNEKFRRDLYYRLSILPICIPPLRERPEDILPIANHFLEHFNNKYDRNLIFSKEVLNEMSQYPWPGNIRELKNVIERLAILNASDIVNETDFNIFLNIDTVETYDSDDPRINIQGYNNLNEVYKAVDQIMIPDAINKYGSIVKAAFVLGIDPSTIHRKIKNGDVII